VAITSTYTHTLLSFFLTAGYLAIVRQYKLINGYAIIVLKDRLSIFFKENVSMRKDTKNFIKSSEYDLETAQFMFDTRRYVYVIFMCHLSLEKLLKAFVSEANQTTPPKSHNLIYLIKIGNIQLPKDYLEFIAKINNASIITRYPEDFLKTLEAYPEDIAFEYLSITKEIHKWLKQDKKLLE